MSLTDDYAVKNSLNLSLTDISYDSIYIYVTVYYNNKVNQNITYYQERLNRSPNYQIPILRLTLSSGVVTSNISSELRTKELEWLNRYVDQPSGGRGADITNMNTGLLYTTSQTLRYEYSSSDWNTGSVSIEFLNENYPPGGGAWIVVKNGSQYYVDASSSTTNSVPTTWPYWFITDPSNPIIIDSFNFGTPPSNNLDPICIPTNNIKFSNIYNVLNDASAPGGTLHNGSDPISISNFVSATHPSTDTMAALTGDIDRKFNFISNEPTEVNKKYATDISINANSSDIYHDLLERSYRFFDSGDISYNYNNYENFTITFDAGSGNFVWINIKNYNIENGYDFLYILASNTSSNFENLSQATAPELSQYLPTSYISGTSNLQLDTWYKINTQYVRFNFTSDGTITESGWDIYLVSSGFLETNDNGLVPKNWIQLSNNFGENIIENNGSIILNSTTKNKLYTPISRFTFSDGPNNLPSYNNTSVNGSIIFDAGEGNSWKIDVGSYTFPYSASGFNLFGQLKIESKANESDYFSNIEKPGLAKVNYGQRYPSNLQWTTPGHVFPSYNDSPSYYIFEDGTPALGTSGSPLIIDERYIKFTYDNNVDNSNYAGDFSGWFFTLQVIDSNENDTENVYNNGDTITDQEVSIKKDFLGRCKNHDPSMQIVEYVDGNYTTDISKNSASGNLQIGLKMPIGAYDLSSSDITIIGGDDNVRVNGFSFTDGDTSTNFVITPPLPPSDALAHKIIIRVKGNTFYNLPEKIWNKPADNDFCWYWNMPIITISSTSVNLDASTNSQKIPIDISCQHNFDISSLLLESGLSNAILDGEPVFVDGSKNATFYIIANNPSAPDISTNVNINIPKEAIRELDSGYFYNPIDISGFSYYYEPDKTAPVLVVVSFTSNNSNNSLAKKGDIITLVVNSNEQLDISSTSHSVKFRDSSSKQYSATISFPSSIVMNGIFDTSNNPPLSGGDIIVSEIIAFDLGDNSGTVLTKQKIKYYLDDFDFTNTTFTHERGTAFIPNDYRPSGTDTYGDALTIVGPIPNDTNWESLPHNTVTVLSYTATDPAGNSKTATLTVTTEDTIGPDLLISYDGTNNLEDKTITFSFTELPIGFDIGNIIIEPAELGATITNLTTSGLVRTALFSPLDLGNYELRVDVNVFNDAAGNGNLASNILNIEIKAMDPTMIEILYNEEATIRRSPFYGLYDYSQFGVIYLAKELIEAGNNARIDISRGCSITSFFFQYIGWTRGYNANNQTVKISHTQANQIERGPSGNGSTSVEVNYSELDLKDTTIVKGDPRALGGRFTFIFNNTDEIGWKEISDDNKDPNLGQPGFDTPFMWDGTSNILISWENRDGSWTSGYGNLKGGGTGNRWRGSHSWFSDNNYPTRASSYNSRVPNIRLMVIPN